MRTPNLTGLLNEQALTAIGLDHEMLAEAIKDTYHVLDQLDETLLKAGMFELSQTVELANLSSMIGNVFAGSIAKRSKGRLKRNGPHKYPDLLSTDKESGVPDLELKMALETNKPKGHLAKEGYYLTCRYVLCSSDGVLVVGKASRGVVAYIWEVRCGHLKEHHFNLSNTAGDSGKTAVVNGAGMAELQIVYLDLERAPISKKGKGFRSLQDLLSAFIRSQELPEQ